MSTRFPAWHADTIHTCGYSCEGQECIRAQRDELAARLTAAQQPAEGEDIMVNTPYDVFILPLRPSGLDGKGPRFVVHVPGAEQPAAACEESSKGADVARPKRRPYNASGSLNELLLLNCGFPTKSA